MTNSLVADQKFIRCVNVALRNCKKCVYCDDLPFVKFFIPLFYYIKSIYSLFSLLYIRYSSMQTKRGPEIYCPSESNASRIPEDVNGLVNYDMQRYLLSSLL